MQVENFFLLFGAEGSKLTYKKPEGQQSFFS
jgi:hypothetical protein